VYLQSKGIAEENAQEAGFCNELEVEESEQCLLLVKLKLEGKMVVWSFGKWQ